MTQLRRKVSDIRAKGAELIVIGNGSAQQAGWFVEDQKLEIPVYTDPSRKTYQEAGFERSVLGLVSAESVKNGIRAFKGGFRQHGAIPKGDGFQLGGVLIIRPGGEIVWSYVSHAAGDHPEPEVILGALAA